MKAFRRLEVWKKAHHLVLLVYEETLSFPKDERYGLTGQIRRACASIPTNIAEGCGRTGDRELSRFLRISMGSASELEYLRDLRLLSDAAYGALAENLVEIKQMLAGLIQKVSGKLTAES